MSFGADLTRLPEAASVSITPKKTIDMVSYAGFEALAQITSKSISDVAVAVEVKRSNLENGVDLGSATVQLAVGSEWVVKNGGADSIWIARQSDTGEQEFLATVLTGTDAEGRMNFKAISPNGFSVFALLALTEATDAIKYSDLTVDPVTVAPGEAVAITVVAENKGSTTQSQSVVLELNGVAEDVRNIELGPGASSTITFVTVQDVVGAYVVAVGGLQAAFDVASELSSNFLTVTDLTAAPGEVVPGSPVTVTLTAKNVGVLKGKFVVSLFVNDVLNSMQPVMLGGGESEIVSFVYNPPADGTYVITAHGASASVTAQRPLTPAAFDLSGLTLEPKEVPFGDIVVVTVMVKNDGEQDGTKEVTLFVNGVIEQTRKVVVEGLASVPVTFQVSRTEPGIFGVEIDDLSDFFRVLSPVGTDLIVSLQLDQDNIALGGTVTATVDVKNPNSYAVSRNMQLLVDGAILDYREITLGPDEEGKLEFKVTLDEAGTHTISINEITKIVTVGTATNWLPIIIIALVVVAALAGSAVWALNRRSSAGEGETA
jgi:uncharacterized cupredoxin-like copper-binding protein